MNIIRSSLVLSEQQNTQKPRPPAPRKNEVEGISAPFVLNKYLINFYLFFQNTIKSSGPF